MLVEAVMIVSLTWIIYSWPLKLFMYVANLIFYKINNFYSLDTTVSPVIVCVIQGVFVCSFFFWHERKTDIQLTAVESNDYVRWSRTGNFLQFPCSGVLRSPTISSGLHHNKNNIINRNYGDSEWRCVQLLFIDPELRQTNWN